MTTDTVKPEPGWYAVLFNANGRVVRVGPPLDDVMRDVERYRWRVDHEYRPIVETRLVTAAEFDAEIDAELAREKETP